MNLVDKLLNTSRTFKILFKFFFFVILVNISLYLSFVIRNESFSLIGNNNLLIFFLNSLFAVIFLFITHFYNNILRLESVKADKTLLAYLVINSLIFITLTTFFTIDGISRSAFLIQIILFFSIYKTIRKILIYLILTNYYKGEVINNIAIYGAGALGMKIHNLIKNENPNKNIYFIDDDLSKQGILIDQSKVFNSDNLGSFFKKYNIKELIFGIQNIDIDSKNKILTEVSRLNIQIKSFPKLSNDLKILNLDSLKDLDDSDFFDNKITLNESAKKILFGKNILVTGAGGSIGSEICHQLSALSINKLFAIDNNEFNLFSLKEKLQDSKIEISYHLLSLLDKSELSDFFKNNHIHIIYHAAAYKHVELIELNPKSAIKNNVISLNNIFEFINNDSLEKFILISTDKAVKPSSVMGITKRFCEILVFNESLKNPKTIYSSVRFGNVIGSSGSVIPKFLEQINLGKPLTVSDLKANRYFMTIPDAVTLVLEASSFQNVNQVYVLDMGEPINIFSLAKKILKYSGIHMNDKEYIDTGKIIITGMKKGEKITEEIFNNKNYKKTSNPKIVVSEEFDNLDIKENLHLIEECIVNIDKLDNDKIKYFLKRKSNILY